MNRYNFELNVQAEESRKENEVQEKLHKKYRDVSDDAKIVVKKPKKIRIFSLIAEIIMWVIIIPLVAIALTALLTPDIKPLLMVQLDYIIGQVEEFFRNIAGMF